MALRAASFVLAFVAAGVVVLAAQETAAYLVELDAVVTDDAGKPVEGLRPDDFEIKDDGRRVEVKTFDAVAETDERRVARSIVLLLDDSGIAQGNTLVMQSVARMFIARMAPSDEFSVIRLNNRRDEAFGDRLEALMRVAEYRSNALPFFGRETLENALQVFARTSRTLEAIEHRRKALVCIGLAEVCSILEPDSQSSLLWKFWVNAIGAMGRANASLYSFEPNGASRRVTIRGATIADATGGDVFVNASDITRPIDIVRRDTGSYYLLGYWPAPSSRPLHTIDVKMTRRGLHVRARRLRGESS